MADFSRIMEHPDKDEIVSKVMTGVPPKDIVQWLKLKYPDKEQSHLRLPATLLQELSDGPFMDYYNQFNNDLALVKKGQSSKLNKKLAESLVNNKTYAERLQEIAEEEINLKKIMANNILIMQDRAIQVFDTIQENPKGYKADYALIKWFDTLFNAMEKYDKHANNAPDQIIQHNITVQTVEQHTAILQEAIRETLAEMDVVYSMSFMDKLGKKLEELQGPVMSSPKDRHKDLKILNDTISDITEKNKK